MSLRYDRTGDDCTTGPQPGTKALRTAAMRRFPRLTDVGIYNCRPVSGGSYLSTHGEGRGWDAGTQEKRDGDDLVAVLIAHADDLSIQEVIWWTRRWTVETSTWKPYNGPDNHKTHVHCAQNWDGASWLTDKQAAAAFAAQPPEEPDMTPAETQMLKNTNDKTDANFVAIQQIQNKLDQWGAGGPPALSDADVDRIVKALIKEIAS